MTAIVNKTRQQRMLDRAVSHIEKVLEDTRDKKTLRDAYSGLCHEFPVLIRTCGLCQSIAFMKLNAHGEDDRASAAELLIGHAEITLREENCFCETDILDGVRNASVEEYIFMTQTLLSAWIYYKRFAESILDEKSDQKEEGQNVDCKHS